MEKTTMDIDTLNQERKCSKCKRLYTLAGSFGQLQCHEHVSSIFEGVFECCGVRTSASTVSAFYESISLTKEQVGCISSDHSDDDLVTSFCNNDDGIVQIDKCLLPDAEAKFSKLPTNADEAKNHVIVWRYNPREYKLVYTNYINKISRQPSASGTF